MAPPPQPPSPREVSSSRGQFEARYRTALRAHAGTRSDDGLSEADALGRQAVSAGIPIPDLVTIHHEARRALFPEITAQLTDVDAFLRASLSTYQHLQVQLGEAEQPVGDEARRTDLLRRLRDVAAELSRAGTRRAVARVMLQATMEVIGGQVGTVAMFSGRRRSRQRRTDLLATMPPRDGRRISALGAAATAIDGLLEPHAPLELNSLDEVHRAIGDRPAAVLGAHTLTAFPIVWRGKARGALIVTSEGLPIEHVDREFVDAVVVAGSPALERAGRHDVDHEIALKLQRGMMSIPPVDAAEAPWSAHYSALTSGLVGGDWFDVIDLEERIGFSIGDIVGHGINSAVAMGQVRSAWRALASCFDKPHELVERLDHFASSTGCGANSSMAYLTINRISGEIAYAVAGHPPPLVLAPDGTATWLDEAGSSLLGRGGSRPSASLLVDPGTTVVLYTDGVVERRGEPLDVGMQRLIEATGEVGDADDAARRIVERLAAREDIGDDVALVVVRYVGHQADPSGSRH